MGNQKFKLSDMIPNAWFNKLKYMGTKTTKTKHHHHHSSSPPPLPTTTKKRSNSATKSKLVGAAVAAEVKQQQPYLSEARKSYHFTRELNDPRSKMSDSYNNNNNHLIPDPPRKSAKRRSTKRKSTPTTATTTRYSTSSSCSSPSTTKLVNSSVSSGCSSRAVDALRPKLNSPPPPPSPINDASSLPESDHLSILPQFSPPDHALLSTGSETLHPTGVGGRTCSSFTCTCRLDSSSSAAAAATDDVVIDVDEKSLAKRGGKTVVDSISPLVELRPILTKKPTTFNHFKTRDSVDESSVEYKRTSNVTGRRNNDDKSSMSSLKPIQGEEENDTNFKGRHDENNSRNKIRTPMRRFVVSSPGVGVGLRLRLSSPRIGRKLSAGGSATGNATGRKSLSSGGSRKSISESFAIVKSSFDPQKDFRESMVEMIVQNNIKDTKELEELLAAYLSLNSDEYHGVIINVFKQIWFDLNHVKQRQRKAAVRSSVVAGNY